MCDHPPGVFADCGGTLRRITTSGGVVHTQASSADRPATSRSGRGEGRVAPPGAAQGVGDEPGRFDVLDEGPQELEGLIVAGASAAQGLVGACYDLVVDFNVAKFSQHP